MIIDQFIDPTCGPEADEDEADAGETSREADAVRHLQRPATLSYFLTSLNTDSSLIKSGLFGLLLAPQT